MAHRCLLALLIAFAVSLPVASAAAAPRVVRAAAPEVGPAVAGGEVLWVESFGLRVYLMRGHPGARPRRVAHLYTDPSEEEQESAGGATFYSVGRLAGAPDTMALWVSSSFPKTSSFSDDLYAGPIGALGSPVVANSGDEFNGPSCGGPVTSELDVTTAAVVFAASGCAPASKRVFVQTLPPGGQPVAVDEGDATEVRSVRIAGRFVAWAQTKAGGAADAVVYDRVAHAVA